MTFTNAVKRCLTSGYFDFRNRAPRPEFWWFLLLVTGIAFGLVSLLLITPIAMQHIVAILMGCYFLGVMVPVISVTVRRLHDVDMSGGVILVYFIPTVGPVILCWLCALKGTDGPNRYGEYSQDDLKHLKKVFN